MSKAASKAPKARIPRGRRTSKPAVPDMNRATTDEFEREDMGVAPKE